MTRQDPILIVGLPRSGTTWIGEVLSSAHGAAYIFEPDNEALSPIAWLSKKEMHRFPYLTPADDAAEYYRLWQTILSGNRLTWYTNIALGLYLRRIRRSHAELEACMGEKTGFRYLDPAMHRVGDAPHTSPYYVETHGVVAFLSKMLLSGGKSALPRHPLIIKSVHSPLSIEWIAGHFPVRVILVLRNPYGLYASYKRLRLPDGFRNLFSQSTLQRDLLRYVSKPLRATMPEPEDPVAFQIMLMYKVIVNQMSAHPGWIPVSHDRLCVTPHEGYNHIFGQLGLAWSGRTDQKIDALNTPGQGFKPKRISNQQPSKWKSEMTREDQAAVQRWIERFDLADFFTQYVNLE